LVASVADENDIHPAIGKGVGSSDFGLVVAGFDPGVARYYLLNYPRPSMRFENHRSFLIKFFVTL